MIDLYTAPTPNGHEASVVLEELELAYEVPAVNLSEKFAENARKSMQR